ncbi:MAG: hypothetical protein L6416_03680 [Candidatus Omnitrophica bacterium]|nr:hypothetical protein [Candidatus Omnitrophota bacterium]
MKMIKFVLPVFLLVGCIANAQQSSKGIQENDRNLIFLGTVIEIKPVQSDQPSLKNWVVKTKIDKIISGNLEEETFSFLVHSPSKSGLELEKQYKIIATWNGNGYNIDEYQWIKK